MAARLCLLALGVGAASAASKAVSCSWDSGRGASFDLTPLHLQYGNYHVKDNIHEKSRNYTYVFNVCGNVHSVPGSGPSGGGQGCHNTSGTGKHNKEFIWGLSPGFQVSNFDNGCWRLGHDPSDVEWGLIEQEDPSRGVTVTYKHGNGCGQDDTYRELKLSFSCWDDAFNIPDEEPIQETSGCHYDLTMRSAFACPRECGMKNRKICNGKGICRYDTSQQSARCFCSDGFEGDDCGNVVVAPVTDPASEYVGVLVVVTILVGFIGVGVFMMWKKVRGLRLDPDAYASLAGAAHQAEVPVL